MEITVVSVDAAWREFICGELLKSPPFENGEEGGAKLEVQFLGKDTDCKPSHVLESTASKKVALFTHPGCGELAEAFREAGVSIINGGRLADAAHSNPEFVTLQAAQLRFFVAPATEGEQKNVVLVRTRRGIIPQWLEYEEHQGLLPGIVSTPEGITLRKSDIREEALERKIDELCKRWGYVGFIFLQGKWSAGEFSVERLSPFGPEAFWPSFFYGYTGNVSKFFCKLENSRKLMSNLEFSPAVTLKATLPPYPYHKTPWVVDEDERKFVENHLKFGSLGIQMNSTNGVGRVTWLDVNSELVSTGAEVGYITAQDFSNLKVTKDKVNPTLQIKELV